MTESPNIPEPDDKRENLPPDLHTHLRSLYTPPPFPPKRDAQILAAMQSQPRSRYRFAISAAIAASLILVLSILMVPELSQSRRPARIIPYARTGDIRDAFYLDRQLHNHTTLPLTWDTNHDGTIDDKDVQSLALAAVQLKPVGGQPQ